MPTRGAKVLHVTPDCMPGADAAFYEYACVMNLENWAFVPESMRSDKIFDAMLKSPWNAPGVTPARIPPLVLQLGPRKDCDNDARVLAAVKHSGYNLQFASPRLRADLTVVAWAVATEEVKKITMNDAREICFWCEHVLNQGPPPHTATPHKEWRETCKQRLWAMISRLSLESSRGSIEGQHVPDWKAAAYFLVPYGMRERLWPWREQHVRIHAELQGRAKCRHRRPGHRQGDSSLRFLRWPVRPHGGNSLKRLVIQPATTFCARSPPCLPKRILTSPTRAKSPSVSGASSR